MMSRALKQTLAAGAVLAVSAWTLAAVGAWWLLQATAGALEGGSTATAMQAVTAWTDRPWVRHWLDPQETEALRDGIDWLFGLGGGPLAWAGTALTLLTIALVVFWAGGLVLAVLAVWASVALLRRSATWWRQGAPGPWTSRPRQPGPAVGDAGRP